MWMAGISSGLQALPMDILVRQLKTVRISPLVIYFVPWAFPDALHRQPAGSDIYIKLQHTL